MHVFSQDVVGIPRDGRGRGGLTEIPDMSAELEDAEDTDHAEHTEDRAANLRPQAICQRYRWGSNYGRGAWAVDVDVGAGIELVRPPGQDREQVDEV